MDTCRALETISHNRSLVMRVTMNSVQWLYDNVIFNSLCVTLNDTIPFIREPPLPGCFYYVTKYCPEYSNRVIRSIFLGVEQSEEVEWMVCQRCPTMNNVYSFYSNQKTVPYYSINFILLEVFVLSEHGSIHPPKHKCDLSCAFLFNLIGRNISSSCFSIFVFSRWVHLLCALYTPDVAFVKPEQLQCVTLSELPPYKWSAKVFTFFRAELSL